MPKNLLTPPTEIEIAVAMAATETDTVRRLAFQNDMLVTEVKALRSLLQGLLTKLPHERYTQTTGECAGCGAVHWCGDGKGKEPCKPDCILQKAILETT